MHTSVFVWVCCIEIIADIVFCPVCGTWIYLKVVSHWAVAVNTFNPSPLETKAGGAL